MNIGLAWVLGSAIFIPFAIFIIGEIMHQRNKEKIAGRSKSNLKNMF